MGNPVTLRIRQAIPADLPVLLEFEQGIVRAERPYDPTLRADPIHYYDLAALIKAEDAEVAVADWGGELIASGYAVRRASQSYVTPEWHAYIGFLYVRPDYRGQGINRKVLDYLMGWARSVGLPEIHLTVYPQNAPALRAYEKAGFSPYILDMRLNLDDQDT